VEFPVTPFPDRIADGMHRLTATLALVLALTGCEHGPAFLAGDHGSDHSFAPGSPRRITYNSGDDRAPAWLPDESGVFYSYERTDRADRDRCLGQLPRDGGRLERTWCDRTPAADDSTNAWSEPAPSGDGRLAYTVASSLPIDLGPAYRALVVGRLGDPAAARVLRTFPHVAPDSLRHDAASQIRWLDATTLVYVAERVGYVRACPTCPRDKDTLRTGVEVVRVDLSGDTPVLTVVPGTRYASSVAAGEGADIVYFTLGGDSRVFRRTLSSGRDSVVHDFGGAGLARDVYVAANRLVAVVGGDVSFAYDSLLGHPVQRDAGGTLYLVDFLTGAETVLSSGPVLFRRPALSPSGKRLVVEAVSGSLADLWMFDLP
jgi:hypothetical protein